MIVIGVDVHKQSVTAVAVDEAGRMLDERTVVVGSDELVGWASALGAERLWALEDCRLLTPWLERQLLLLESLLLFTLQTALLCRRVLTAALLRRGLALLDRFALAFIVFLFVLFRRWRVLCCSFRRRGLRQHNRRWLTHLGRRRRSGTDDGKANQKHRCQTVQFNRH